MHGFRNLPRKMLSVVLIESERTQERAVSCFGALEIVMRGGQPEFRSYHLSAAGMGGSEALCERLAELSADRHIILGQPAIHGDFWDWEELLSIGSLFMSSIRTCEDLQPSGLAIVTLSGRRLNEISERMKLRPKRRPASLEAARLARDRAQLLWLGYVEAQARRRTRDSLFAAFQAWSVIERARPLPF